MSPPLAGLSVIAIATLSLACVNPTRDAEAKKRPSIAPPATKELKPVNIEVVPVALSTLTEYITVSGTTMADSDVTYSAEIAGRIETMTAELGDRVRRGQVLARIDYGMLKAQADAAQAAHELAKKTFERVTALEAKKLVSQQRIDEARSRLVQAEAQWRIADANLNKSVVRAVRSGVVTRKPVDTGEFVVPGAPIYQIVDYSVIVVQAQLPETVAARVKREAPARVRIDSLRREVEGRVRVVVPAAAQVSKTFELQAEVDNPDLSILVGMAASVRIVAEIHENAVVAPHDVVIEEDDQRSVFVESGGVAHRRPVVLGAAAEGRVVLQAGVEAGDRLVVLGHRQLVDGQPVRIVQ